MNDDVRRRRTEPNPITLTVLRASVAAVAAMTAGACVWIVRAEPEALGSVFRGMAPTGLLGLLFVAGMVAGSVLLGGCTRREHGNGGDDPPDPDPTPPADDLDAELIRLLEEGRRAAGRLEV